MLELAHKKCYTVISHRTYNNIITMMKMQLAVTILINKLSPLYRDFTEIQNSKAAIYKKLFVKIVLLDNHVTSKSIELALSHILSLLLNIGKIKATPKIKVLTRMLSIWLINDYV